jgi:hypothetical protein
VVFGVNFEFKYFTRSEAMKKFAGVLMICLVCSGCTGTQKGATVGGLLGAGLGTIIGYQSGHAGEGALIGGAVGAAGGALAGDAMEEKKDQ